MAKLEALRRKRVEVDNAKPKIIPAKEIVFLIMGAENIRDNTVFETENYAVGVPSTGQV